MARKKRIEDEQNSPETLDTPEHNAQCIAKIDEILLAIGCNDTYNSLSNAKLQSYLFKIEELRSSKEDNIESATKLLGTASISYSEVAEKLGISRTTIYNNPLLGQYVEFANKQLDNINLSVKLNRTKEALAEQTKAAQARHENDVDILLLKRKNEELEKALIEKSMQVDTYSQRILQLAKELNIKDTSSLLQLKNIS